MLAVLAALVPACWPTVTRAQEARIGVFDAGRVSEETEEGKRVQKKLSEFRDAKQAQVAAKEKEMSDLQTRLSTQALSLAPDKRAELEKEIQRKLLELNQARETATREMQIEINEAQESFQAKLLSVIAEVGREEGFSLILESSLVAYADKNVDITTVIVDRFNRVFKVEPAATPGN
jgi:outer membrane protein